jgi:hypothetical protein
MQALLGADRPARHQQALVAGHHGVGVDDAEIDPRHRVGIEDSGLDRDLGRHVEE